MDKKNKFNSASLKLKTDRRISLWAGDNSVVNNKFLPSMQNPFCVIISEDVYDILDVVGEETNTGVFEIPFVLTGYYDKENQQVIIDDCFVHYNSKSDRLQAIATNEMEKYATDFVKSAKPAENKVIVFGHTHPRVGNYYLNFSRGDIMGYINNREQNQDFFDNHNLATMACLLTGGNFNFLYINDEDTYKFDNVFVQKKDGSLHKLPAFGSDVARINNNQNTRR